MKSTGGLTNLPYSPTFAEVVFVCGPEDSREGDGVGGGARRCLRGRGKSLANADLRGFRTGADRSRGRGSADVRVGERRDDQNASPKGWLQQLTQTMVLAIDSRPV